MSDEVDAFLDAISKQVWDYKDVKAFFRCSNEKAYKIIKIARENGGETPLGENLAKSDAVLALINTNKHDLAINLRRIKNGQKI